jgi:antitoxin (DNA-binding transcriptional repressor) of toxin-antitoxin stability system
MIAHKCTFMYNFEAISRRPVGMKTVTFTEFRKNASGVMDLVEQGESFRVMRHGKAIARIVPAGQREARPAWKRRGLHLIVQGISLSRAVLEERRLSP